MVRRCDIIHRSGNGLYKTNDVFLGWLKIYVNIFKIIFLWKSFNFCNTSKSFIVYVFKINPKDQKYKKTKVPDKVFNCLTGLKSVELCRLQKGHYG